MRYFKQYATKATYSTVLYCTVLLSILCSCSKGNNEINPAGAELVNRVWECSKANPDGFTLDIQTFEHINKGIAASYKETQNCFGRDGLKKAINHALKHNHIVGGWLNSENGYYYFDSTKIFEESKLDDAIQFAKENGQIAVYDLTNQKEILVSEYDVFKNITQQDSEVNSLFKQPCLIFAN